MNRFPTIVASSLLIALAVLSCKKDIPVPPPPQEGGGGGGTAATTGGTSSTAPATGTRIESNDPMSRVPSFCPEGKVVNSGDRSTPGGTVYLAYKAALKGDTPEAFEEFFSLFTPESNRDFVRVQLWPRAIQHVKKYVADDGSFVQCRTMKTAETRTKIFVKCNDPKKSDPPIVLENAGGTWKIDTFTP